MQARGCVTESSNGVIFERLNPRFLRYSMFFRKLSTIVSALASFIGVAKIAFVVQSYMMKTALVPSNDVIGKFPVRSAYIVPSFGSRAPNAMNNWLYFSVALG
eukprot:scaffold350177_cov33-Attheya_sp.AAC.1